MTAPDLISERLLLTAMTEGHISDEYLSWLNDKELMRFSRQRHFSHTKETSIAYQKTFLNTANYFWAIEDKTNGNRMVGSITAYVDTLARTADVGIMISPAVKGQGFGKTAWGMVLKYLFEDLNLRKVTAGTVKGNLGMEGIASHWGMILEGVLREQELIDETPCDVLKYGLLRNEWLALNSK